MIHNLKDKILDVLSDVNSITLKLCNLSAKIEKIDDYNFRGKDFEGLEWEFNYDTIDKFLDILMKNPSNKECDIVFVIE